MSPPLPSNFQTLSLSRSPSHQGVAVLELNRPRQMNAIDSEMFRELPLALGALAADGEARAVVLRGAGRAFCAGADLATLAEARALVSDATTTCPARQRLALRELILSWQSALSALELSPLPCVVAVHGACVGAGVDLVTAADVRVASADATFCVKEVDLAITADLGTLQRLPHLVGGSVAAEWCLTGKFVGAAEAASAGLVSKEIAADKEQLFAAAEALAGLLASKSPLALQGTKAALRRSRDAPDALSGLEAVATWNAAFLASEDGAEAWGAMMERRAPRYRARM
jgi:enoyl-CoA hydratase/carnithine racemase